MDYWHEVTKRAWQSTAKALKVETREAVVLLLVSQVTIAAVLWFALGPSGLESNLWGRAAAAAAPFLVFFPVFLCKFAVTPPLLAEESDRERARLEDAVRENNSRFTDRAEGNAGHNAQIARLLETISELLVRQSQPQVSSVVAPKHLQDLRFVPAPEIRARVGEATHKMRTMENAFHSARNSVLFGPREDWNVHTNRIIAQSQEQTWRWRSELMPEAVALWDEMRRRIYGAPPYPQDRDAETALKHGMLAGPAPLAEAATALERLARDMPG